MSGGSLEYIHHRVRESAGTMRSYQPDDALVLAFADFTERFADALYNVEYWLSGDFSEEDAVAAMKGMLGSDAMPAVLEAARKRIGEIGQRLTEIAAQ